MSTSAYILGKSIITGVLVAVMVVASGIRERERTALRKDGRRVR